MRSSRTATHHQEIVILRLRSEILKDHLLHEPLHEVPVLDDPMSYRPLRQEKADA